MTPTIPTSGRNYGTRDAEPVRNSLRIYVLPATSFVFDILHQNPLYLPANKDSMGRGEGYRLPPNHFVRG